MLYLMNVADIGISLLTLIVIKQACAYNSPTTISSTITTEKGMDVILACPPTHSQQDNRNAYWFFNSEIQLKKRLADTDTGIPGTKKLANVKDEDSGDWFYQKPPPSNDVYCKINLVVKREPTVSCKCENTLPVQEGAESVKFNCTAEGIPAPTIGWFRRDTPTSLAPLTNGSVLVIYDVSRYAIGQYVCVAKNEQGHASCEVDLNVHFQTEMEVYEEVLTVTPDQQNVTLMCRVTGSSVSASTSTSPVYWARADDKKEIRTNAFYTVIQDDDLLQSHHTIYVLLIVDTRQQMIKDVTGTYLCKMGGYSLEKSVVVRTLN